MERRARIRRLEDKEDLLDAVRAVAGREPPGIRHILNLLSQPDILEMTIGFFDGAKSLEHNCQIFSEPWNCILQDEALNETIRSNEWLEDGTPVGTLLHEDWCDPCRKQVLEDQS